MAIWQYGTGPSALTRFGPGFEQAVVYTPPSPFGGALRAIGTFSSPEMLGLFALCMVVIGIIASGLAETRGDKALVMLCIFLACVSLLVSGTRGALLGTVFVAACMFLVMRRPSGLMVGALILTMALLLVAVLLNEAVLGRFGTLLDAGLWRARLGNRLRPVLEALGKAPMGAGMGYASVAARHVLPEGRQSFWVESYPLKIAWEMGVPGVLAFLWLVVAALVQGRRSLRQATDARARWVTGNLAAFVGFMLVFSVIGAMVLDKTPTNVFVWFFLGVLLRAPELSWAAPAAEGPAAKPAPTGAAPPVFGRP
jgi:hypothetical protein